MIEVGVVAATSDAGWRRLVEGRRPGLSVIDISKIRQAAERGIASAQLQLGLALLDGRDVPADPVEAFHWLSAAAEQGAPRAIVRLARMHLRGVGTAENKELAVTLLEQAAAGGEFMACIELARMRVTTGDVRGAKRWYEAALAQKERVEAPSEIEEAREFLSTRERRIH